MNYGKRMFFLLGLMLCSFLTQAQAGKPNIIFILADDMGYGDVGCYGQQVIRTPNIDMLAKEGMLFRQHYAGAPVCAPSRCVLMTGRDIGHARVRGNYENGPYGFGAGLELRNEDYTLGEMMKERGYVTGMIGKWGMGVAGTTGEPNKKGFDYSYGFLNQGHAHYQYPEYLFRNGKRIELPENKNEGRKSYSNNLFTDEAMKFTLTNKGRPFFLYLAYTTPHAELLVPDDTIFNSYKGRFEEKPFKQNHQGSNSDDDFGSYHSQDFPNAAYAACITHLDLCVGKLISFLKQQGLYENTLIIFSSDNGPAKEGGADPLYFKSSGGLRGKKRDVYEGGIREPMIAVWPSKIKAASVTENISGFQDVMATLADATGKPLASNITTEGISFYSTLTGNNKAQKQHPYLYWEFHENKTSSQALRMGNWKAVRQAPDTAIELYDLSKDITEQVNVADKYPSVVKKMGSIFVKARESHPLWPLKTLSEAFTKKKNTKKQKGNTEAAANTFE